MFLLDGHCSFTMSSPILMVGSWDWEERGECESLIDGESMYGGRLGVKKGSPGIGLGKMVFNFHGNHRISGNYPPNSSLFLGQTIRRGEKRSERACIIVQ